MQPIAPLLVARASEPNIELLRRHGWNVNCLSGSYCVAWRGSTEVVFQWRDNGWQRVGGRSGAEAF